MLWAVLVFQKFRPKVYLTDCDFATVNSILRTGYHSLVMARSDLLEVLLSQVPKEKIHFNKRITSFQQNKDEVTIRCEDDTQFQGQILVGADGADSGVRINLYRLLTKKGILNRVDAEELVRDHVSFVGVTKPLSEDKYPILSEENSHCHTIVNDQTPPFTVSIWICCAIVT